MLYGLLMAVFIFICILLVLLILIQQGKGSMGMGAIGGGAQMLFGGSGGQDIFQKITWILGSLFMAGSLLLALMKNSPHTPTRISRAHSVPVQSAPAQNK